MYQELILFTNNLRKILYIQNFKTVNKFSTDLDIRPHIKQSDA